MKTTQIMAVVALINVGALALHVASAQQPGTRRTELDPGVAFGKHRHPGEEIIYVLEGSLECRVEGKPPMTLRAGDVLFIPAGTIHSARNVGSGNGAELATYIVEKGKPLVVMVK